MKKLSTIISTALLFAGSTFAQVGGVDAYLTVDNADVSKNVFYPKVGMGEAMVNPPDLFNWTPGANDWTYKNAQAVFYIVPSGTQSFFGADFTVKFDNTKLSVAKIEKGDLFPDAVLQESAVTGGKRINTSNLTGNIAPEAGKYLAKVTFNILVPGYTEVTIENSDFRYYDPSDLQVKLAVTPHKGSVKFYVGDFSSGSDVINETIGDGVINISDLQPFSVSYWKEQPAAGYRAKFDVGPNASGGQYFAMPKADGKIEFEDLMLFSIGYGKSGAHLLTKNTNSYMNISAGAAEVSGDEVRIPVVLNGSFSDLRGLSFVINTNADLKGIETAGEFQNKDLFIISKTENGKIYVDAAVIGPENPGLSKEGTVLYLVIKSAKDVSISDIRARDSYNEPIKIAAKGTIDNKTAVPTEYTLEQNYPNPFNPSTVISYQLPKQSMVEISIFNSLGKKVASIVNNEMKDAGYYTAIWDASGMSSGIYYYTIKAGEFTTTKKMMLIK